MRNCIDNFKKSWKDLDKLSKLNENWEKLIGLELSKACKPLKIEQKTLIIAVNHPQWRQALIYNKHRLKESISGFGINLNEIKIIQNYEVKNLDKKEINAKNNKIANDKRYGIKIPPIKRKWKEIDIIDNEFSYDSNEYFKEY